MFCPKCNGELTEGMLFCIHCGAKLESQPPVAEEIPQAEEPTVEIPQAEEPTVEIPQAEEPETPVSEQAPFRLNLSGEEPEKPKMEPKKKKAIIRITALVTALALVLTGVVGFVFGDWGEYVGDFFSRMQSAEKYKGQVEQEALSDPDAMSEIGAAKKRLMNYYRALKEGKREGTADVGLTLMLGEGGKSLLSTLGTLGMDLDEDVLALLQQIDEIEVRLNGGMVEDSLRTGLNLGLNGTELIAMDALLDLQKGELFMGLPGLSDQYLKMTAKDMGLSVQDFQALASTLEMSTEWTELLPEADKVEELIDRCITAAMDEITEVEKANKELSIGDIKQTVTVLTYELGEEDAVNVALAVLKELEGDQTVQQLLEACSQLFNDMNEAMGEETYPVIDPEEAMDAISDAIAELEDYEPESEGELKIDTYVNKKGQIIGRSFRLPEEAGKITYMTLEQGKKLGFRMVADIDGEKLEFEFTGEKKKDLVTGTGFLDYNGEEMFVLKLKGYDLNAGTGTIRLELGKSLQKQLDEQIGMAASLISSEIALEVKISTNEVTLWLLVANEEFLGLSLDYSYSDQAVDITAPKNVATDPNQWAASLDPQALLDALEKAGISEDMLEALVGTLAESQVL